VSLTKEGEKQKGKMFEEQHKTRKWAKAKRGLMSKSP
jgi:hypothetical protein